MKKAIILALIFFITSQNIALAQQPEIQSIWETGTGCWAINRFNSEGHRQFPSQFSDSISAENMIREIKKTEGGLYWLTNICDSLFWTGEVSYEKQLLERYPYAGLYLLPNDTIIPNLIKHPLLEKDFVKLSPPETFTATGDTCIQGVLVIKEGKNVLEARSTDIDGTKFYRYVFTKNEGLLLYIYELPKKKKMKTKRT